MRLTDGYKARRGNPWQIGEPQPLTGYEIQKNMQTKKSQGDTKPQNGTLTALKHGQLSRSTENLLSGLQVPLKPSSAFLEGTNIRRALSVNRQQVRLYLLGQLDTCLKMVDASTTMQSQEEKLLALDMLIEEFPAFTVEEFHLLFRDITKGKYKLYNRLKLAEFMECARQWEGVRAVQVLEQQHRPGYDPYKRSSHAVPKRKFLALTVDEIQTIERQESKQANAAQEAGQANQSSS